MKILNDINLNKNNIDNTIIGITEGGTNASSAVDARENLKILTMTESAYNSLPSKDANTIYICY